MGAVLATHTRYGAPPYMLGSIAKNMLLNPSNELNGYKTAYRIAYRIVFRVKTKLADFLASLREKTIRVVKITSRARN
jgi:hypothetical protein